MEQLVRSPASHHLDLKLNLLKMEEIAAEAMALTKPAKVEVKDEPGAGKELMDDKKKENQNQEGKKDGENTEKGGRDEQEKEKDESHNKVDSEETEDEETKDEDKEKKGVCVKEKTQISTDLKDIEKVREVVKIEKKEEKYRESLIKKADKVKDSKEVISSKASIPEDVKVVNASMKSDVSVKADVSIKSEQVDAKDDSDMPKLRPLEMGEDMPPAKARPRLKDEPVHVKKELSVLVKLEDGSETEGADALSETGKDALSEAEKDKPTAAVVVDMGAEVEESEDPRPDYVKLKEKIIKTEIERINEERLRLEREVKKAQNGVAVSGHIY